MPNRWTAKDERQYAHIKQSEVQRGRSPRKATEIAARTVNKARRKQGRTSNRTTQGTGNPTRPLTERTVAELKNRAADLHVRGRSRMSKEELIRAIRTH